MLYYYDKKRSKLTSLKEGNRVYLLIKNIRTKRLSKKLNYQKLGPYPIKRKLSKVIYELNLLKHLKIHPIFYISLLELIPKLLRENAYEQEADNKLYKVKKLLKYKTKKGKQKYLV